jgi:hypothetical protein
VDSNGVLSFVDAGGSNPDAVAIPSVAGAANPAAALYPFWHDWVVDAQASVRTATTGAAPNRRFIVEWRNVRSYVDPQTRVSFEIVFDEPGGWAFAYADLEPTYLELGGEATIGVENADDTHAVEYLFRHPALRPGLGVRFTPLMP